MKTKNKAFAVFSILIVLSMVLAACAQPTPETVEVVKTEVVEKEVVQTVEVVEEVIQTVEVEKVVVVTPTPQPTTRTGGWVDQLVFTEQNSAEAAVQQLLAGELDVYAYTVNNAELYKQVQENPDLAFSNSFGSYNELSFNPAVCLDPATGEADPNKLNPFSNPKIREAMNYLMDRNYIVQEIYGGLGVPKWFPITAAFPDYARYVDVARSLEAKYAYNPEMAKEMITAEMEGMGATLGADGKWTYNGNPVVVIVLIRTEDERVQIGDYVSNQLETLGFTVDRQKKTRSEASPIWVQGNPADCLFNIYTGGWITTAIARDQGSNFSFFYTPRDYPIPLHQAYTPSAEFDEVALKLRNNDFTSMEERGELFAKALELAMQDSVRVWLADNLAFSPFKSDVTVSYDLAGAIAGSRLYPLTLRFTGEEGGVMRIAQPGVLVDPWNPLGGSNWIYDMMPIRAASEVSFIPDPYTGLAWPWRAEGLSVTAQEGLPIAKTLDWVNLEFVPTIEVPGDAWVDWDAVNQKFITAAEKYTSTQTAKVKQVVTYPADMFETVKWHDGSPLTMGDFVMSMILAFDPGKEDSPIYDESLAEGVAAFLDHFKGVKVVSTNPLTIETYDDLYQLDAELNYTEWFPMYAYGSGAWHNMALANLAVSDPANKVALTADKAEADQAEWLSMISGPSLEVLKTVLDEKAVAENYIPYAPTMGEYVTAEEATARWTNLSNWFAERNHFWLGTGPYYLYRVFPVEGTVQMQRFADYPDLANRWDRFGEPQIAVVEIDGPGQVAAGSEATFDVFVTFNEQPYPAADIGVVQYLVFDATGALVTTGDATLVTDGQYQVVLGTDVTGNFTSGAYKLEIAVAPIVVSIPTFASYEFVVP